VVDFLDFSDMATKKWSALHAFTKRLRRHFFPTISMIPTIFFFFLSFGICNNVNFADFEDSAYLLAFWAMLAT